MIKGINKKNIKKLAVFAAVLAMGAVFNFAYLKYPGADDFIIRSYKKMVSDSELKGKASLGENNSHPLPYENKKTPNIVFINIDTLRADRMSAYGYEKSTTPFLESLFEEGVVFENATAPGFITPQTDAAIFSGLFPSQNNVQGWDDKINEKLDLLPRILSFYGYKTAAFVCFGLGESFGFNKQFDFYDYSLDYQKNASSSSDKLVSWISSSGRPFFAFWHIYDVHFPYVEPTEEFYDKNYRGIFLDRSVNWNTVDQSVEGMIAINGPEPGVRKKISPEDVEYLRSSYDSGVKKVDEQIKIFFEKLKEMGLYENTIFVISSEHGEDLKEHGFIFHRDLYEVNTHVPLAIINAHFKAKTIAEPVSSVDIMPTIIDIIGGTAPQNIEGKSLVLLMKGKKFERDIFSERAPFDEFSIRRGDWKYILRNPEKRNIIQMENLNLDAFMKMMITHDVDNGDELYNLKNDPYEQDNLVGKGLDIEAELKESVSAFKEKMQKARIENMNVEKAPNFLIPYP